MRVDAAAVPTDCSGSAGAVLPFMIQQGDEIVLTETTIRFLKNLLGMQSFSVEIAFDRRDSKPLLNRYRTIYFISCVFLSNGYF